MSEDYIVWKPTGECMGLHAESAQHYVDKGYLVIPVNWIKEAWAAKQTPVARGATFPTPGGDVTRVEEPKGQAHPPTDKEDS